MSTIIFRHVFTFVFILLFPFSLLAQAQNLTDGQINAISARLAESALASWELGTRSQAILELNATAFSVFSSNSLPPPSTIPSDLTTPLAPFFAIARSVVSNRTVANNYASGPQPFLPDGSAGDPASIGMCVLLANWTNQDAGKIDYGGAAKDQLDFLFQDVPKTSDGAISHRVEQVQLWSDFIYMVPPFLAYYGVVTRNRTLLSESYMQIQLYRNYLFDPTQSLWKHVLLGSSQNDEGYWSTGNGWAAAGILRVLATIRQSEFANTFKAEQKNLSTWVQEIHLGMYTHLGSNNLFTNYANQPATAPNNFYDASSTALLASTVYRAALMLNQFKHISSAEKSRKTLISTNSSSSSSSSSQSNLSNSSSSSFNGYTHLTSDGWLTPVVNPGSYGAQGQKSPESEAFMVEMQSAWRDWVKAGSHGGACSVRLGPEVLWAWAGVNMLVVVGTMVI